MDESSILRNLPPKCGKRALITGITGQDGSYLAELLLGKGYEVWGAVRRPSSVHSERIRHLHQDPHAEDVRLRFIHADLLDAASIEQAVQTAQPDEVYNLGAQSHVRVSFDIPEHTGDVTGLGAIRVLEAIRKTCEKARFYQASSSELYGNAVETPQRETTPFAPRNPYAVAKAYAFYITKNYREAYDMFAVNGILFNHESPRRGDTFVSRKITQAAARIRHGLQDRLFIGNLAAERDWGFAGDYVDAMWRMLQADRPDDYVIATGEAHSVREFCERAFALVDLPVQWRGEGLSEKGIGPNDETLIEIDPRYFRPADVDTMRGDASKAKRELGWAPQVSFEGLVERMVASDLAAVERANQ